MKMRRIFTLAAILLTGLNGYSQVTDTIPAKKADTIRVGGMVIVRDANTTTTEEEVEESKSGDKGKRRVTLIYNDTDIKKNKTKKVSTFFSAIDLGFSNYVDNSDYAAAQASGFVSPDVNEDQMTARAGKSRNVNIWFWGQKANIIKNVVGIKYMFGLELNNYHFENKEVRFSKSPTHIALDPAWAGVKKNKLAADYLTVPIMLDINFTPNESRRRTFGIAAGVSAGYLYSARQKIKDGSISKTKSDFDLERWKLSYVGEITLGPVQLYGSYAAKSMFKKGLDMAPYTVGIRLGGLK